MSKNITEIAKSIIIEDIRGITDDCFYCDNENRSYFMLGGLLYFATVIDGAIKWSKRACIDINPLINNDLIEKLRAKIKLYSSDKRIPINEQWELMYKIIAVEKQYWIDLQAKSGKYCPKFLIPNMGLYSINGHYIGNTIEYAYEFSPFNPELKPILEVISKPGEDGFPMIYHFSTKIGKTMQELHKKLAGSSYEIKEYQRKNRLLVTRKDIRMENRLFFINRSAIFVLNLCCRINYLLEFFEPLCTNKFLAFRMIYITFYHFKNDMERFGLKNIYYNMPYRDKAFRDAMAHYSLFGKMDDSNIIDNVTGYGLVEKFFNKTFETVYTELLSELSKTRDSLEKHINL